MIEAMTQKTTTKQQQKKKKKKKKKTTTTKKKKKNKQKKQTKNIRTFVSSMNVYNSIYEGGIGIQILINNHPRNSSDYTSSE